MYAIRSYYVISINHTLVEAGSGIPFLASASLHSLCPFGGVVTIYQFATVGTFVQKIHESAFVLMIIAFLIALLFGPAFCGWICPLGTVQEWVGKLGKKLFKRRRYNHFIPAKIVITSYSIHYTKLYDRTDRRRHEVPAAGPCARESGHLHG